MIRIGKIINIITSYVNQRSLSKSFKRMTIDSIELFQYEQLKKIINHAWETVPFYRNLWKQYDFCPDKFNSLKDIELLPIIDRNDIIDNLESFIPADINKKDLTLVTTGGTSGMPMKFYIDNSIARAKEFAFLNNVYEDYADFKPNDKVAILIGLRIPKKYTDKKMFWRYSFQQRGLVFSSFHLTKENFHIYITKLRQYRPSVIRAYPSAIVELCVLMKLNDEKPLKSLKKVVCSSENVYQWQRDLVKEVLDVEIWSLYGHSEKCVMGIQVDDNKMLFHPLYGFTEFLKDNNAPASKGDRAEIIVTGFHHDYFPIIRYRTNDLVEVYDSDSSANMIAKTIIGREQDFVIDKNNNRIQFTNHDEPFWQVKGIIAYQYIQSKIGKLLLKIQTDDSYDNNNDIILISEIKDIFVNFDIELIHVDTIEKTKRGKFKYLIQNLTTIDLP